MFHEEKVIVHGFAVHSNPGGPLCKTRPVSEIVFWRKTYYNEKDGTE